MTFNFPLDRELLRADLHELSTRSKALKSMLRQTWLKPMADEQRELCRVRLRLTELCTLRAHERGRLHRRERPAYAPEAWDPWQWQASIVERLAPQYVKQLVRSA